LAAVGFVVGFGNVWCFRTGQERSGCVGRVVRFSVQGPARATEFKRQNEYFKIKNYSSIKNVDFLLHRGGYSTVTLVCQQLTTSVRQYNCRY
jgi:hypothetical protein